MEEDESSSSPEPVKEAGVVTVTTADGSEEWYRNGKLHRDDGPAITTADGSEEWYRNGKLHRDDGPAIVYPDGTGEWYREGNRYRDASVDESPPHLRESLLLLIYATGVAVLIAGIAAFNDGYPLVAAAMTVIHGLLFFTAPTVLWLDGWVDVLLRLVLITLLGTLVLQLWAAIVVAFIVNAVFTTALDRRALRIHANAVKDGDRRN